MTTIPLGPRLLEDSSDLPGDSDGPSVGKCQRHPIWSCSVRGFACHPCYHGRGALLPHLFTLTLRFAPASRPVLPQGGIFSVPLVRQVALPGSYPAHCPPEFGLSSRLRLSEREGRRSSGRLRPSIVPYSSRFYPLTCTPPRKTTRGGDPGFSVRANTNREQRTVKRERLPVHFLLDPVLFEFLIEIAARGVDHLGGLGNIPAVLPQLLHQVRALGGVLELAQCPHRARR